ncbi:MAG TPA: AAA family ATPase [Actinomycetes bacterium]|nr:AAA family ATPase [Actinomycetes bacterium]
MPAQVEIRLLGVFGVVLDGRPVPAGAWPRRQAASLVKLLALAPGRRLHREQVVDALWPDLGVEEAAPRLHKLAHYARRALGEDRDAVVLRDERVALLPGADVVVDAHAFQEAAEQALAEGTPAAAAAAAERYTGTLLADDRYEPWAEGPRDRLRLLHLELLRRAGRWEQLLAEDPADEEAHLALMRRHAGSGDVRAGLRQFERMDRALRNELGVAPSPAARALRDRLLAALPGPLAPGAGRDGGHRLVGRERELGWLERQLSEAAGGRGRAVLVSGPAGVGKSALLDRSCALAMRLGWRAGRGGAAAVEGAWPYAPALEALADLCRRHPALLDGLDDTYREEIDRALAGRELTWSGEGTHQRLFVAAAELLRLAAAGPGLLLAVDDLHEADEASLRLLHYLARCAPHERAVLLLAHRPGGGRVLDEIRRSLLGRRLAVALELRPLGRAATATLVRGHLAGASEELVEHVWAVSGGLPFTVLELARGVRPGSQALPAPGPQALAGLAAGTREVLQRAAVVGATFDTDQFVALSGLAEGEAYAELDAALTALVLERTGSGYRFRHALVRDALLADLPPHRRRGVHRDAAERLAALGASPAQVAHHLVEAGEPAAAVPFVLRAVETEAAMGAYRDALGLVEAVRGAAGGDDLARLLALRAELLSTVGDAAAVQACREALAAADPAGGRRIRARMARAAISAGDLDTAAAALEGLEPDGGPADSLILLARGGYAYFSGDLDGAWAAVSQARRLLPDNQGSWHYLDLVALQGLIAHNRGEWFERLRLELRQTRDEPALAIAVFDSNLCVAEYLLYGPTPYQEVIELARALRRTAQRAGILRAVAFAAALVGEAALLAGDLPTAERELREAADLHREIGASAGEAHSLQRLAEVRLAQGRREEADRLLARALVLARWSPTANHLLQRVHGTMIAAEPDAAAARVAVERAEAALGVQDTCQFCAIMLAVPAAIACADAGDLDEARRHLATAERSLSLWEGTAWQGAILEARAHLAGAEGDAGRSDRLLGEAGRLFERAGQPLDAARCRATAAR